MKCGYRIVFMEASDPVIIRRYKETRRNHPLAEECGSLEEAIALERNMLAPLKERADWVIDTSNLSTRALRGELLRMFSKNTAERSMEVRVMSFGFKHGIPAEADLVFDVRFLPNPYYVAELRPLTGLDAGVRDYALSSPQSQEFLKKLTDFVTYLLPRYLEEGKAALVIAVGCTGGHHRSGGGGPRPGRDHPRIELPGDREPPGHGADVEPFVLKPDTSKRGDRYAGDAAQRPAVGARPPRSPPSAAGPDCPPCSGA